MKKLQLSKTNELCFIVWQFSQWLLDNDCHDVCMESTDKYWVPVFNLLEDEINVVLVPTI